VSWSQITRCPRNFYLYLLADFSHSIKGWFGLFEYPAACNLDIITGSIACNSFLATQSQSYQPQHVRGVLGLAVTLSEDARAFLEQESEETGVPLSNLVSYIAVNYVREERRKDLWSDQLSHSESFLRWHQLI
jgi:hypothetical protein